MLPTRKRRRPPLSCAECRRRKVKCDRKDPCCHCILWERRCVYDGSPPQHSGASYAAKSSQPTISRETHSTCHSQPSSDLTRDQGNGNRQDIPFDVPPTPTTTRDRNPSELNRRLEKLERLVSMCGPSQNSRRPNDTTTPIHPTPRDAPETIQEEPLSLQKSKLFGKTHWSDASQLFKNISTFLNTQSDDPAENEVTQRLKLDMRGTIQQHKVLCKSLKLFQPSRHLAFPDIDLPARDTADRMAHLYVTRFESVFRILHIPSFWSEYEKFWRDPTDSPEVLKLKVHLVIAIGSSLCPEAHCTHELRSAAHQWVHKAQNWLSGPLEKNRVSISGLQVQCLLILARQALYVGGDLIWISMGTVIRTAMQMGLHRDPRHFVSMTVLHAEIRRRLWATILEMNVQAALDAGAPAALSFDDFDTEPPANVDDEDLHDSQFNLEQRPDEIITDTSLQRFLLGSLDPRLQMLHLMNNTRLEIKDEEKLAITTSISNACRECTSHIKKGNVDGSQVFQQNLADLLLRRFLLRLHRPWANNAGMDASLYLSRKFNFDAAMALLSPAPDEGFSHLIALGGGIFKHRLIHVSLALASELLIEIEEHGRDSAKKEPCSYRKMLIESVEEARRQWGRRMQLCESNMKVHMKLSIILEQARKADSGVPMQQRMAQNGKQSLEMCYSLLQARSGNSAALLVDERSSSLPTDIMQDDATLEFLDFDEIWQTTDFEGDGAFGLCPTFS